MMLRKIAASLLCISLCVSVTACKKPAFLEKLSFFKSQSGLSSKELDELLIKAEQGDQDALDKLNDIAEKGKADDQISLGDRYHRGEGVSKDVAKAIYWYQKAADQGNAQAVYTLGIIYMNGLGVPKDDAKAFDWFQKSAEQGDTVAQYFLGHMYENGKGVPKDDAKAIYWYQKAAKEGDTEARIALQRMQQKQRDSYSNMTYQSSQQTSSSQRKPALNLGNIFERLRQNSSKTKSAHLDNEEPDYLK